MLGVLVADDEAPGKTDDRNDPAFGHSAHVVLARARYDIFSESYVGLIATDREFMNGHSRVAASTASSASAVIIASDQDDRLRSVRCRARTALWPMMDIGFRKQGRNLSYGISHWEVHPHFGTDVGFVRRVDMRQTNIRAGTRGGPRAGWSTGVREAITRGTTTTPASCRTKTPTRA